MSRVLVTGATGFIGYHLVKRLSEHGVDVSCLIRKRSRAAQLEPFDPHFVLGDVTEPDSFRSALEGVDTVYHLAGATKALKASRLWEINEQGTRNVAGACAALDSPPLLIHVSSLAAAGPATAERPLTETDPVRPVSNYGLSKLAAEQAVSAFASQLPVTIVRPPIVLGEFDTDGLEMFKGIATWGVHIVPGFRDHLFSVIHAADLAAALMLAADRGQRVRTDDGASGYYFASADESLTYGELGRLIGRALGRRRVAVLHAPSAAVWSLATVNEGVSRLRRRPHILNFDKAREAAAGSWACSSQRLCQDTGYRPEQPLLERLRQTAQWYVAQGMLKAKIPETDNGDDPSASAGAVEIEKADS